jgi:hypothetical protein
MIEPRPVNRRGTTGVLSSAEYHDCVRLVGGRFTRRPYDAKSAYAQKQQKGSDSRQQQQ